MEIQVEFGRGLRGVLHRPARARKWPAVVALHGFTGNKIEDGRLFVRLGRDLAAIGIGCLRFDFWGSGDSDGDFSRMRLSTEMADAQAALAFLRAQRGVDRARLGLLGLSLGSVVAQCIAAKEQVAALALWATITAPREIFTSDLGAGERGFATSPRLLESLRAAEPLAALARYKGPLLCVHGDLDFVPRAQAQAAAAQGRGSLVLIEGGDHTFGSYERKGKAITLTRRFFARSLAAARAWRD